MPHSTPVLATSLEARVGAVGDVLDIESTCGAPSEDGSKKLTAVSDVSLSLRRGETFGLVGESGSGKTTLAKCITGLIAADSGTVTFEGKRLRATAGRRSQEALRAIQMVFQNPDSTLNPAWSTRAILTRAVRKLGSGGGVRAKVDKLSADVRVEPRFLAQKPTDLSGGQKQRIAIARAFAGDPTLVVCDEPASALDVSVQASILNLLVELQTSEQVSYVFISHDLAVVRYISDRIGVMYLAELIEVGSADEVFNPPHHPYTEALLSSIPKLEFDDRAAAHPAARLHAQPERAAVAAAAFTRAATASSATSACSRSRRCRSRRAGTPTSATSRPTSCSRPRRPASRRRPITGPQSPSGADASRRAGALALARSRLVACAAMISASSSMTATPSSRSTASAFLHDRGVLVGVDRHDEARALDAPVQRRRARGRRRRCRPRERCASPRRRSAGPWAPRRSWRPGGSTPKSAPMRRAAAAMRRTPSRLPAP